MNGYSIRQTSVGYGVSCRKAPSKDVSVKCWINVQLSHTILKSTMKTFIMTYFDSSQNKEGTTEYEAKSSKFALEKFYVDNATKSVLKIEEKKVSSIFWKQ